MSSPFQFPEVRVVEASAGSGKTYTLAKRYVQLLLFTASSSPLSFKHILAITFTNKAAAEMKGRIIDLLKRIALGQLPKAQVEDMIRPLGLDERQAATLAAALMEDLIRHYHFFQVQTIDSFMNTLLAGCAFKLNLSARFKIKRNAVDYLQLSVDELIDVSYADKDVRAMFEAFVRQYLFLENRSGWFPKKDLLAVLGLLFNQHNTYQMPFLRFPLPGGDVITFKKEFLKIANGMQDILPEGTDKKFRQGLTNFLEEHPAGFDIDDVSRYFAREQCPVKAGTPVSDELDGMWQNCRRLLRAICLQEAYAVFNPYVDLFAAVMLHFGRLQTKEDVLFLQQLNKKASGLFDDSLVTVEELYYRLATRFNHYLMDEFQDTSEAQWHNLRLMVEESLSRGGTLFYVGDKKQAIYSFRGGTSELFDGLQAELDHFNVRREVLEHNYRSRRAIVDLNNNVFSLDNLNRFATALEEQSRLKDKDIAFNEEDRKKLHDVFATARQTPRADLTHGLVRVEIIPGKKKNERLELTRTRVLEMVAEARKRFALRDIAVLTRNNTEVQQVTQWLIHEGIYARSERTSDLKNHPLILELVAFLRFVHSPADNGAFAEFLSGDIFTKVSGLSKEQVRDLLFACRLKKTSRTEVCFYKEFRESHPELWQEYFEASFSRAGVYPLYELAVGICGTFGIVAAFPDAQGFIMHFLELIKRREEDSCDLETFLEYFDALENEERFVPMPAQDAVHVLTVHKAKGLGFPVVIIPFLEMSIKVGAGGDGGQSFAWDIEEEGIRLLRMKESYTRFADELRERYAREYKESFFAELNAVYVALTRAAWEMYVLIPERVGNSVNPVPFLIPPEIFHLGEPVDPGTAIVPEVERLVLPPLAHYPWITRLQEEFLGERAAQSRARREGEIMHFCLAQVANLSGAGIDETIDRAVLAGQMRFAHECDDVSLRARLNVLLQLPSWKKFFFLSSDAKVLCEQEVVNAHGDARRMDRLIVFPKDVWVVDFKTSRADEDADQHQVDEYRALLAKLYPGRAVSAFLLYLDESHG